MPEAKSCALNDPAGYRFWTPERLRFADLDPLGHANNNAFGVWFQEARVHLFEEAFGQRIDREGLGVVLARITIDYLRELRFPADIRIGQRVARIGRTSITLESGLFKGDEVIATSQSVTVLFDQSQRRPAEVPEALRRRLMELAGPVS